MSYQHSAATDAVFAIQESIRQHATYSLGKAWRDLSLTRSVYRRGPGGPRPVGGPHAGHGRALPAGQMPSGCTICPWSF